ncbi:MAG: hypothetical protein GOMPHAMPRED_001609 [Gomphillus americanus]|uniref:DDH domain-containing protein n=1 Tax=Gomphillus americanus TaxID=1940652 RepID=A0A8H3IM55_9LECA|nr:MAG: hypothetical protein GOMPHAMPRED_001609 [Gomphillus americanus]
MKRKAPTTQSSPKAKRQQVQVPDYCDTPVRRDQHNAPIWPAPEADMTTARNFFTECATNARRTLLVPDKDADGLSAGVIAYRTLLALNLPKDKISVHLLSKGTSVHDESERKAMLAYAPERVIVLDQGSRRGPRIVDDETVQCLVVDHHARTEGENPEGAIVVSACDCPPVSTASLLTYTICSTLHPSIAESCRYLAAIGTHGDLGTTLKWKDPFPPMDSVFKTHTKKTINDCVSLLNAPRRTSTFDVISAWNALCNNNTPEPILKNIRLLNARADINEEVERCTHTPPKFSRDGRVAVLRINSPCQVHPVIATRWAGHLKSKDLEIVMVANEGYFTTTTTTTATTENNTNENETETEEQEGKVNFSCRIARSAKARLGDDAVDIISLLKEEAGEDLVSRMGESFARGHKEASGGIVGKAVFEEFLQRMGVGEKKKKEEERKVDDAVGVGLGGGKAKVKLPEQKNSLMNYFAVKT